MLDLNDYFDPVSIERHGLENLTGNAGFPHNTVIHTENITISDFSEFQGGPSWCARRTELSDPGLVRCSRCNQAAALQSCQDSRKDQRWPIWET